MLNSTSVNCNALISNRKSHWAPRLAFVLFVMGLALHIHFAIIGWDTSLSDRHEFRQTQTAIAAREIARNGLSVDNYIPVLGPPWTLLLEFPIYQNIVGALARGTGWPIESVGRLVSLSFFYSILPALFLISRRLMTEWESWVFLSLVVSSPVYLFWSRTVMIESLALAFSLWGLWFLLKAIDHANWLWILVASATLGLAGLAKLTTLFDWLLVAGVWWIYMLGVAIKNGATGSEITRRFLLGGGIPVIFAALLTLAWAKHVDHVNSLSTMTAYFTSANESFRKWNFGSWNQFTSANSVRWLGFLQNVFTLRGSAIFLVITLLLMPGKRLLAFVSVVLFVAPLLVFTNLFYSHDYYYYANGILFLAAVGFVVNAVLAESRFSLAGKLLLIGWIAHDQYQGSAYYRSLLRLPQRSNQLAEQIKHSVPVKGVVVAYGFSWNPALAYYSDRKFIMLNPGEALDSHRPESVIKKMSEGEIVAMVVGNSDRKGKEFIAVQLKRLNLPSNPSYSDTEGDLYIRDTKAP